MGRKSLFEFEKYIIFDPANNISKCVSCQKVLKGRLSGNIRRHYKTIHNIVIDENNLQNPSSSISVSKKGISNIQIHLNKKEFLLCCVGLVTVKNMPFRIFDDEEYFKKLLLPYEEFHKTNINSKNIVSKMNVVAKDIKSNISKSVFKKMVCLKIDIATRMEKSMLGINIQYIKDSKININTIGMIQLKKRHTAQFLKEEIIKCLKDFKIEISQIYACTFDNEPNVLKTSKLLKELQEEMMTQDLKETISDDEDSDTSSLSAVKAIVGCAAHTIQLAAHDVLKTIQPEIDECRKIVKSLRTIVRNDCSANLQMPPIDNVTRWNSTYKMLQSIENFKEYIQNIKDLSISEPDWNFTNKFLKAFKPLAERANKFQLEQYIIGDFYRDWLCCEIELEGLAEGNIYAENLLNSMRNRKQNLLVNEVFISAIYLDPRFNFKRSPFLSEEQKKTAMNHLLKTQKMIKGLASQCTETINEPIPISYLPSCSGNFSKLEAKVDLLIEQTASTDRKTKRKLENLCNAERVPFKTNILDYWKSFKTSDAELEKLLDVALSVPATQVSVERAFSALSITLSKMRSKLSKETIKTLLLVKLNKNFMEDLIITSETYDE